MASISMETKRLWNSLETARLIASLTTPIMVALIGFWINAKLKADERRFNEDYRPHTAEAVFAVPQQGALSA